MRAAQRVEHASVSIGGELGDVLRERHPIADRDVVKVIATERTPALDSGALRFSMVVALDGAGGAQTHHPERQPIEGSVVEVIEAERFHEAGVAQAYREKICRNDDDLPRNGSLWSGL